MHPLDFLNVQCKSFGRADTIGLPAHWGEAFHHGREAYLVSFFPGGGRSVSCRLLIPAPAEEIAINSCVSIALAGFALALGRFNPIYHWLFEHF